MPAVEHVRPFVFYGDETNTNPSPDVEFFIYGGVWLPGDRLADLAVGIDTIRLEAGFAAGDKFKFDTNSRPATVSREAHTAAKKQTLALAADLEVTFAAVVVLHAIATTGVTWEMNVDTALVTFRDFLHERSAIGIAVLDRTEDVFGYLAEIGQFGARMRAHAPIGGRIRLDPIYVFATSCIGASQLGSLADIVLGSFRFCVNDRRSGAATAAMLPSVVKLMWHEVRSNGTIRVRERGYRPRPMDIRVPAYEARYEELRERLETVMAGTTP